MKKIFIFILVGLFFSVISIGALSLESDTTVIEKGINPKTGYPAMHSILSATIVANDCMTADAYATTCMVIGLEKSKILLSKLNELDAYLIYTDPNDGSYQVYITEGMKDMIEDLN